MTFVEAARIRIQIAVLIIILLAVGAAKDPHFGPKLYVALVSGVLILIIVLSYIRSKKRDEDRQHQTFQGDVLDLDLARSEEDQANP